MHEHHGNVALAIDPSDLDPAPPSAKGESTRPRTRKPVILQVAKRRSNGVPERMDKELKEICLKMELAQWTDPRGQAVRDAVRYLMKKFGLVLKRLERGQPVETGKILATVDALETAVRCLPGRRLPGTRDSLQQLATAIQCPIPAQGETEDECILRETVEKGSILPLAYQAEIKDPAERARHLAQAKKAADEELARYVEEQAPGIA